MYCKNHEKMVRCNSVSVGICEECGKVFMTSNAPPLNKICTECSDKTNKCEYCRCELK